MNTDKLLLFRQKLDEVDSKIVNLILIRFQICEDIGLYKKEHSIPLMQPHRIQHVKQKAKKMAEESKLNPHFMEALYSLIIEESCEIQNKIIKQ